MGPCTTTSDLPKLEVVTMVVVDKLYLEYDLERLTGQLLPGKSSDAN